MKRSLRALLWVPAGALLVLLLLEGVVQLGALLVQDRARPVPTGWLTGHTRILALGDSNTYGFYLRAEEAWPAQLERQWNAAYPERPVEVLNLGYPGSNSFRVLDSLPGLLDKLTPDVVFIMVGFNDFWTPPEAVVPAQQADALDWLKTHSRLYRFYSIWSRSRVKQGDMVFGASRDPAAPLDLANPAQHEIRLDGEKFYLGTKPGAPARNRNALADNLAAMIALVRERDAQVVLMTYPSNWGFYPGANKWLKAVADTQAVPLVDITPLFIARCTEGPVSCPALLFHDGHATAQGNTLVAAEGHVALQKILQR